MVISYKIGEPTGSQCEFPERMPGRRWILNLQFLSEKVKACWHAGACLAQAD
jgi:hypothetical protein